MQQFSFIFPSMTAKWTNDHVYPMLIVVKWTIPIWCSEILHGLLSSFTILKLEVHDLVRFNASFGIVLPSFYRFLLGFHLCLVKTLPAFCMSLIFAWAASLVAGAWFLQLFVFLFFVFLQLDCFLPHSFLCSHTLLLMCHWKPFNVHPKKMTAPKNIHKL